METLLSHRNPPGPTGFLWMAAGVRLAPADSTIWHCWQPLPSLLLASGKDRRFAKNHDGP
jgi:hypothetical protein